MKANIISAASMLLLAIALISCGGSSTETTPGGTTSTVDPTTNPNSGGENRHSSKAAAIESNVVVLTPIGMMPSGQVGLPVVTNYYVGNKSDRDLTVVSVEVVNVVGSAFSLDNTDCLNFVIVAANSNSCRATVVETRQAKSAEGRLIVGMNDNTIKTAHLQAAKWGRVEGSPTPTPTPTLSNPSPSLTSKK